MQSDLANRNRIWKIINSGIFFFKKMSTTISHQAFPSALTSNVHHPQSKLLPLIALMFAQRLKNPSALEVVRVRPMAKTNLMPNSGT
jgi:hypothetical protein